MGSPLVAVCLISAGLVGAAAAQDVPPGVAKTALEGTINADEYVIGPGDVLGIGLWGEILRSEAATVTPDGDVLVTPVGPVRVGGLTLRRAREVIGESLAPYYKSSILSVSLVAIRDFQIHVVGAVGEPGAFRANAVTRVSQAIDLAGGLATGASVRNIMLMRDEDTIRVDLTRYLLTGSNALNPFLKDGDVVCVPLNRGPVMVFGSVYRPGVYEYVPGENLADVFELAGWFRPEADTSFLEIQRFDAVDPSVSVPIVIAGERAALSDFKLSLGDRVFVRSIPEWHADAQVEITGEVRRPGVYVIEEGRETLSGVVARAGGFTEKASLAEARLVRGAYAAKRLAIETQVDSMSRVQDSRTYKEKDLMAVLSREPKGVVSVGFEQLFLGRAGYDPPLYGGDRIEIPRAMWFVRVSGQAKHPGLVAFSAGKSYRDYVKEAGGFAPNADKRGTRIIRAMSGQTVRPGGQTVMPGDIIWIPTQEERDWWEMTKEIIQILAQIATIYVVADQIASE